VFQKECSSVDGVGSGDAGFGGRNREALDLGNGAFFAAIATFYTVGKETAE